MPLQAKLTAKRGKASELLSIVGDRRRFPGVSDVVHCKARSRGKSHIMATYKDGYAPPAGAVAKIAKKYGGLGCVSEVAVLDTAGEPAGPAMGALHLFPGIDSTLTGPHSKIIQNKVRNVLDKMLRDGHRAYLVSGSHSEQVNVDIRHYGAERLGISENGGMMASPDGNTRLGDRSEPDEVMHYMKMNHRHIVEDIPQGMRVTERIFRKSVPEREFKKYVRESGAAVDVLASKASYHVAKRGVNKGSAIERLKTDLVFNEYDVAVGVGDSDLDVPMFRESNWSFAVHNATRLAKKSASVVLEGDYGDAIAEMYDTWLSRGQGRRRTGGRRGAKARRRS